MEEKSELFSSSSTSNLIKKNLFIAVLALGGVILLAYGGLQFFSENKNAGIEFVPAENEIEAEGIFIDISGAVISPGVYEFSHGMRISDAIDVAGGFTNDADIDYISKNVNKAQKLADGMKLYFPFEGETEVTILGTSSNSNTTSSTSSAGGLINLNTASQSQLETLPRIGPITARKMIDGRPYSSVDDLLVRKIVGASVFDQIKDLVTAP